MGLKWWHVIFWSQNTYEPLQFWAGVLVGSHDSDTVAGAPTPPHLPPHLQRTAGGWSSLQSQLANWQVCSASSLYPGAGTCLIMTDTLTQLALTAPQTAHRQISPNKYHSAKNKEHHCLWCVSMEAKLWEGINRDSRYCISGNAHTRESRSPIKEAAPHSSYVMAELPLNNCLA